MEQSKLTTLSAEPDEDTIRVLEEWLTEAKSGTIQAVVLVAVVQGGPARTARAGHYSYANAVFSLEVAKTELIEEAREGSRSAGR